MYNTRVVIVVEGSTVVEIRAVLHFGDLPQILDDERIPHAYGNMVVGSEEGDLMCHVEFMVAGGFEPSDLQQILDFAADEIMRQLHDLADKKSRDAASARRRKGNYRNN